MESGRYCHQNFTPTKTQNPPPVRAHFNGQCVEGACLTLRHRKDYSRFPLVFNDASKPICPVTSSNPSQLLIAVKQNYIIETLVNQAEFPRVA